MRLATMHRVKGLEFAQVFLPELTADQIPLRRIVVTFSGQPSPFIGAS